MESAEITKATEVGVAEGVVEGDQEMIEEVRS